MVKKQNLFDRINSVDLQYTEGQQLRMQECHCERLQLPGKLMRLLSSQRASQPGGKVVTWFASTFSSPHCNVQMI